MTREKRRGEVMRYLFSVPKGALVTGATLVLSGFLNDYYIVR